MKKTDRMLNEELKGLLKMDPKDIVRGGVEWINNLNRVIVEWNEIHPDTVPPAYDLIRPKIPIIAKNKLNIRPTYRGDFED